MKCPNCQTENREGVKFCEECGAKMEMACPSCGAMIPLDKKFCGECGHKLKKPEESPPIDFDKPNSYTPKFMAEKILTTRSAIEGERKLVTVLFADVANYTSMSEKLDPEEVHQIMDGCFKILMDEIHKYEGTINQFTGDGVMALFGAPLSHEDHAQRACYASLAIQEDMRGYSDGVRRRYGADFRMRIGLNSGHVVIGAIGDDLRMDYTAVGDTTNLAARMESMAEPGTVLITANTQKLAKDYFALKSLGMVQVKGKKEPQEVFQLAGVGDVTTRLDLSVARGLTKYIGRKPEIESLLRAFEKVSAGSGQVVGIVGEAGVGKSRLVFELRRMLHTDCRYLEGRCVQFGRSIPFLPLLDVLRSTFEIKEGDPENVIKEKITNRLKAIDQHLLDAVTAYHDLLSLKIDDETWLELNPQERRARTFEAIRNLLIRLSEDKPLIFMVDDLHWMDKTSEEFIDYLIGWLAQTPILLLLLYRPEYAHPWGSRSYYHKIGLDQLPKTTSAEFIQSLLVGGDMTPGLRQLILSRAAGNPLFMEELTRTLIENGLIEKRNDQYALSERVSRIEVPDSIQGIIAARMDRLEDNIKRTMQEAAVIGKDFAYRVLQMITGMREDLKSYLLRLQNLEFIYEKSLFPELAYIFKHALTQEVAYNSLLLAKRNDLHERIGRAIEQIYSDRIDEFLEMLAYHFAKSDNAEKAYHYQKLSGEKAMRNHSAWEAFSHYKEAKNVLEQLPQNSETTRKRLELVHLMLVPVIVLGFPEGSRRILEEGSLLAKELGDQKSYIRFQSNIGLSYANRGRLPEALTYAEKAFEEAERIQDVQAMAQTAPDVCLACSTMGDYARAIEVTSRVGEYIERAGRESDTFGGPTNIYSAFFAMRGFCKGMIGDFPEAIGLCEQGLKSAAEMGGLPTLGICEYNYANVLLLKGEARSAREHFSNSIQYLEEAKFVLPLALSLGGLGLAIAFEGDPETGLNYIEKGLNSHRDAGIAWNVSIHLLYQGICFFEAGDMEKALVSLEQAYESAKTNLEKNTEGKATIWVGRVMSQIENQGPGETATTINRGMALLKNLGTKPDLAIGYLFLGEHYFEHGKTQEAIENLKKAESMFHEMEMHYWLRKAGDLIEKIKI